MPRNSNRGRRSSGDTGVMELARKRPMAAAAVAASAAAAGLFLWSRRSRISEQLSNLSEQVGEWTNGFGQGGADDTAGLTAPAGRSGSNPASAETASRAGNKISASSRVRSATASLQ